MAILIAAAPLAALMRDVTRSALLAGGIGSVLLIGGAALPWLLRSAERAPYFVQLRIPALVAAIVLLAAAALVWRGRRGDVTRNVVVLGAGMLTAVLILLGSAGVLAPVYSGVTLAAAPAVKAPGAAATDVAAWGALVRGAPLYSLRTYDQTLPFYWRQTVRLVDYRGELDYGLRHDPAAGIASLEDFQVRWALEEKAYAVMEPATFDSLRLSGVPMREIARDVHRVLVARQ